MEDREEINRTEKEVEASPRMEDPEDPLDTASVRDKMIWRPELVLSLDEPRECAHV